MSASSVLTFTDIVTGIQVIDKYKSKFYICVSFPCEFTKLHTNNYTKLSNTLLVPVLLIFSLYRFYMQL